MEKFDSDRYLVDILKERRETSDLKWVTRNLNFKVAYGNLKNFTPADIKSITLNSYRLKNILKMISQAENVPLESLYKEASRILKATGYNTKVPIMRWLALFVNKIFKRLWSGVYINEGKFLQIRAQMGSNPLVFVPSHKSYCDFILLSYLCFGYDIALPRVAAGMDFHSMAIIGNLLRNVGAFFIRRSFANDSLYSAVFSQYVNSLITFGAAGIEFFIEGTRSRTQKALMPKFGFLSMVLKPFIIGLVPDITIVPVSLSYDRILEEVLFVYELLGVAKPKESTKGFLKALDILDENYGKVYVKFGNPFSVKDYFKNRIDRSVHGFGAVEMQELTSNEIKCITELAHHIVRRQKELTVITCFNLIATILNNCLFMSQEPLYLDRLVLEVKWLYSVLKVLSSDASLWLMTNITEDLVMNYIKLHKNLVCISSDKKVQLCRIYSVNSYNERQLKAHKLSDRTMDIATIFLMLQYYSNPCASFLIGVCLIGLIVQSLPKEGSLSVDMLLNQFKFLCSIFSYEFVLHSDSINKDFEDAFNHSQNLKIIQLTDENKIQKGDNDKLGLFCINFFNPYFLGIITVMEVFLESTEISFPEKEMLKICQERLELKLNNGNVIHPANLSLDLLTNTLQSLVSMNAVSKSKGRNGLEYKANEEELGKIYHKLKSFDFFSPSNTNVLEHVSIFLKASL